MLLVGIYWHHHTIAISSTAKLTDNFEMFNTLWHWSINYNHQSTNVLLDMIEIRTHKLDIIEVNTKRKIEKDFCYNTNMPKHTKMCTLTGIIRTTIVNDWQKQGATTLAVLYNRWIKLHRYTVRPTVQPCTILQEFVRTPGCCIHQKHLHN